MWIIFIFSGRGGIKFSKCRLRELALDQVPINFERKRRFFFTERFSPVSTAVTERQESVQLRGKREGSWTEIHHDGPEEFKGSHHLHDRQVTFLVLIFVPVPMTV